jgi:hypothetical protein
MDRHIKLAINNSLTPNKNSLFDLEPLQLALNEIVAETTLGAGYFYYDYVDETTLTTPTMAADTFATNIQIWEDADFNTLYNTMLTINSSSVTDPNAIIVTNANNRRQFYIVFRQSCFSGVSTSCTGDAAVSITPSLGTKALIARALSRLISIQLQTPTYCTGTPSNYLCPTPADSQWSTAEKLRSYSAINSALELIGLNSSTYYQLNPLVP